MRNFKDRTERKQSGLSLAFNEDYDDAEENVEQIEPKSKELKPKISWEIFDKINYLNEDRFVNGQDKYAKNQFNQEASDLAPFNRTIPDTREEE